MLLPRQDSSGDPAFESDDDYYYDSFWYSNVCGAAHSCEAQLTSRFTGRHYHQIHYIRCLDAPLPHLDHRRLHPRPEKDEEGACSLALPQGAQNPICHVVFLEAKTNAASSGLSQGTSARASNRRCRASPTTRTITASRSTTLPDRTATLCRPIRSPRRFTTSRTCRLRTSRRPELPRSIRSNSTALPHPSMRLRRDRHHPARRRRRAHSNPA